MHGQVGKLKLYLDTNVLLSLLIDEEKGGVKLGEKWDTDPRLKIWFHRFDALIGGIIVVAAIWFIWSRWQLRIRLGANQNIGGS
jgi:hypothetical protein